MRVFLSYRRSDVGGYAGRLVDALSERLGAGSIFQDVTTIGPGEDFTEKIDQALEASDTVLAVIGPGWLGASTPEGVARLSQPDDYVRLELANALGRDIAVVPVLVGSATLPTASDLPEELRGLVRHQVVTLHDETWHEDVEGLLRRLRREPAVPVRSKRVRASAVAGAVALVLLAGVVWVSQRDQPRTGATAQDITRTDDSHPACPRPGGDDWHTIGLAATPAGVTTADGVRYTIRVLDAQWRATTAGSWQVVLKTSMEHDDVDSRAHGSSLYDILAVGRKPFSVSCMSPVTNDGPFVRPGLVGEAIVGFDVACPPEGVMVLTLGDHRSTITVTRATTPVAC